MALFKIVFSLLLLAAAEECDNSERDEVQLLQAQDKGREIQPDWTKIVDAAKTAVNSGIGKVTTQLSDALDTANTKILAAGTKFNQSVEKFESKANANFTVSQNLSAFKSLIDANVKQFVPSYNTTLKQVTTGLATTKTVMGAMGQKELAEKLEKLEGTVTDNLRALADSTQAMAQDMTQATADNYGDYFATMKKKLQFISSTSASFKSTFESQLEAFSGALLGPLEVALGDKASTQISDLTAKADLVLGNLQQVVGNYSQGLKTIGETVDVKLQNTNSEGFFGKIFHGLFR